MKSLSIILMAIALVYVGYSESDDGKPQEPLDETLTIQIESNCHWIATAWDTIYGLSIPEQYGYGSDTIEVSDSLHCAQVRPNENADDWPNPSVVWIHVKFGQDTVSFAMNPHFSSAYHRNLWRAGAIVCHGQ